MPDSTLEEIERGWELLNEGQEEEALEIVREIEKRGDITQEEDLRCQILKGILVCFLGRFEEALKIGKKAYQESLRLEMPLLSIDVIFMEWVALIQLDRVEEAKKYIVYMKKTLKSTSQEPKSEVEQREAVLNYIRGWFFFEEGKLDPAKESLEKSLAIFKRYIHQSYLIPGILMIIGSVYFNKGELEEAQKLCQESLGRSKGSGIRIKLIELWDYARIGEIYYQQGELDLAIDFFEKSVKICEQEYLIQGVGLVYDNLIRIFLDKNDLERVNEYRDRFQQYKEKVKGWKNSQFYEISNARILKSSTRTRDKAKAEAFLIKIIEECTLETKAYAPSYNSPLNSAMIALCELYFEELKTTNDMAILEDIHPLIGRLISEAERTNSYSLQAHSFLLQGVIKLLQMNMGEARQFLTQAQRIANKHGLRRLARAISYEHDKMLEQLNKWENLNITDATISEIMDLTSIDEIIDGMQGKRAIKAPEIVSEKPELLLIIGEGGILIFSHPFIDEWKRDDTLFSSFLSAFSSFSNEFFTKGLDRAKFGDDLILMQSVGPFSICYLFKGQSYPATQRLTRFTEQIQNTTSIWQTLETFYKTSQVLELKDNPSLDSLITEIFFI